MPLYQPAATLGRWLTPIHGGIASTSQTFTVGRVLLVQIVVPSACWVDGVAYTVGSASNGNVVGGLVGPTTLTADVADAAVVVAQSASTAQGTANTPQVLTWTAVLVRPGVYYAALEGGDVTGTYMRHSSTPQAPGTASLYDRAGGYGALTDPTPTVTGAGTGITTPGLRLRVSAQ